MKFHDHVLYVINNYLQISDDLKYLDKVDDRTTARQFIRQLMLPEVPANSPTPEQRYLRNLMELPSPVLDASRAANRILASKARPRKRNAYTALMLAARDLSFEAYHFHERMKDHLNSTMAVHLPGQIAAKHKTKILRVFGAFKKANDRLLRHRNFVVHGPSNRVDEFSDLRLAELSATILHDDLWFEFNNVFEECKQEWSAMARALLKSMEASLSILQHENENAIAERRLTFVN